MQTQTRKFGDSLGFESAAKMPPLSRIKLAQEVRVLGLKRKAKNGTRFKIQSTKTSKRQPTPYMLCEVVKTAKDGTVTARTLVTNSYFELSTKDKVRWPDAKPVS